MSGTYPATPEPAICELTSHQPAVVNESESRKRQARIVAGHQWQIKMSYDRMHRSQFSPIFAFAASQRGNYDNFTIVLPQFSTPQGVATGSPTAGAASAGATSVVINGFTGSVTGIMKAGDLIKFAGHTKVYMLTADKDSSAGGQITAEITPPLIEDVASSEVVTVNNVPFTVAFQDDILTWKMSAPNLSNYTVNLIEHIA